MFQRVNRCAREGSLILHLRGDHNNNNENKPLVMVIFQAAGVTDDFLGGMGCFGLGAEGLAGIHHH